MGQSVAFRELDVLLVSMPFASFMQPSIALSLLKNSIADVTSNVETRYFTLDFAEAIGVDLYGSISQGFPITYALTGEWLFNNALFNLPEENEQAYITDVLWGQHPDHANTPLGRPWVSEKQLAEILTVRRQTISFIERCCNEILEKSPKVVGFTSVFQQNVASLALAQRLKHLQPEIVIVFGGANCEGEMGRQIVRSFPFVDYVVSGEGESAFPKIIAHILHQVPFEYDENIYQPSGASKQVALQMLGHQASMIDLNRSAFVNYDEYFEQFSQIVTTKVSARPRIMFETSRGCWWGQKNHCTFCGLNGSTMTFRSKDANRALDELKFLSERYPGHPISVVDNILDMKYFQSFIPDLISMEMDLQLFYEVKANLKKSQVKLLADAGITSIQPGIESLSTKILDRMRKGVRGLHNIQLLKWCKEYGVSAMWNVLWGFPDEEPEEYQRMADMVGAITHLKPPGASAKIRLDRFSPNFDQSEQFGFANVRPYPAYSHVYPLPYDAVFNLSYFFAYDYKNAQNPEQYTRNISESLKVWRRDYPQSDLFYFSKNDEVFVIDLRSDKIAKFCRLSMSEGFLLDIFDEMKTLDAGFEIYSETTGASRGEFDDALEMMSDLNFILRDGSLFLGLPIKLGVYSPPKKVLERLGEVKLEEVMLRRKVGNLADTIYQAI